MVDFFASSIIGYNFLLIAFHMLSWGTRADGVVIVDEVVKLHIV